MKFKYFRNSHCCGSKGWHKEFRSESWSNNRTFSAASIIVDGGTIIFTFFSRSWSQNSAYSGCKVLKHKETGFVFQEMENIFFEQKMKTKKVP